MVEWRQRVDAERFALLLAETTANPHNVTRLFQARPSDLTFVSTTIRARGFQINLAANGPSSLEHGLMPVLQTGYRAGEGTGHRTDLRERPAGLLGLEGKAECRVCFYGLLEAHQ